MLDQKILRQHANEIAEKLKIRGFELDVAALERLEHERKQCQIESQTLQQERNAKSKEIGMLKAKGEDPSATFEAMRQLSEATKATEEKLHAIQTQLNDITFGIPNIPHDSVPAGETEDDNIEVRRWGEVPSFSFDVKDHEDLGIALGLMDFETAAKITGSRYVVLKGQLSRLQRALTQFMLDTHTANGYQEVYVPFIVNSDSLFGTGQLPKFGEDLFALQGEHEHYLIPTAEVPITNMIRDSILDDAELPSKWTAHTPCFRSEAGSYGKDTKGMIRQHQFEKVELVHVVHPDDSYEALEQLTQQAESILQQLGLAYRVVTLCGGDLGFSATKTYDIEVWLPAQNRYREISSCSNFEDFQARRLQARYRDPKTGKPQYVHTLNGSGLAVGRTLVAVLENYQQADGSIEIPAVLRPYMNGLSVLKTS